MEQTLFSLQDHMSLARGLSGIRGGESLVFCVVFRRLLFVHIILAILSSALRFTDSDCPFGIFQLFICDKNNQLPV